METCDVMQAEGTENPVRFYVCRIMPFDDNAAVKQNKRGCAWVGNGKCNKQKAAKGNPLIRVVYYKLDCSDPRGTVFVDTQEVSMANGLGIRRVLANGTFQKQEREDEDDIPLTQLKSAMQLAPRVGRSQHQRRL
jgi:hypothetical protein